MFAKKGHSIHLPRMLVWLGHEMDCFDNPTTYLPYMEGKADFRHILQSPVHTGNFQSFSGIQSFVCGQLYKGGDGLPHPLCQGVRSSYLPTTLCQQYLIATILCASGRNTFYKTISLLHGLVTLRLILAAGLQEGVAHSHVLMAPMAACLKAFSLESTQWDTPSSSTIRTPTIL